NGARDSQESHRFTDLPDLSGGPCDRTDHLSGHIRGPQFRGIVRQYVCAAAADDTNSDCGGNDGAKLYSVVCCSCSCTGGRVSDLVPRRIGTPENRQGQAAGTSFRRYLGEVSGGAVLAYP